MKSHNSNKKLKVYNKDIIINITTLRENRNIKSILIIKIINNRL